MVLSARANSYAESDGSSFSYVGRCLRFNI
nr:unnamed protein product [Callosobruchus chinensis]